MLTLLANNLKLTAILFLRDELARGQVALSLFAENTALKLAAFANCAVAVPVARRLVGCMGSS